MFAAVACVQCVQPTISDVKRNCVYSVMTIHCANTRAVSQGELTVDRVGVNCRAQEMYMMLAITRSDLSMSKCTRAMRLQNVHMCHLSTCISESA